MVEPLRILILEDNPTDAELAQFELEEAGIIFTTKVVMAEKDFILAIQEFCPDLILSDYDLPKYNGALALAEARKRCPDTPFILVTGAVSEDRAIEILTQGAKDYVLKSRLEQRLAPAVRRALAEAEEHRARKQAEAELREAHKALEEKVQTRTAELEILNRQLQALFDYSAASLVLFDAKPPYTVIAHNKYYQELWDEPFRTKGMVGKNLLDYVPAVEQSGVMAVYDEVVKTKQAKNLLGFPYDGMPRGRTWWNWHLSPIMQEGKVIALAHMGIDVTKEVLAREESERRAKEAEEGKNTLDALMACIPEGITIANAPDVVTTVLSKYGSDLLLKGWETAKDLSMEDWLAKVEHYMSDGRTPARTEDLPLWRAVKCGETLEGQEFILRRPTGELLPILCNAAPIRDKDGKITGGIVAWRDITGRKGTEEKLRESEERFRVAQELSPDGFAILRPVRDSEGRIVDFTFVYENAAIARINGTDPAAVVGRHLSEFLPAHSQSPFHEAHAHVADTGETCIMERKYDGGDIPRPTWFRVVVVRTGQDIAILSQDITERKRAEEALGESEKRLRMFYESGLVGMFSWHVDGRIIEVNDRYLEMVGYSREDFDAGRMKWAEMTPPEYEPLDRHALQELAATGVDAPYEKEFIRKDGSRIPVLLGAATVNEDRTEGVAFVLDITERKRAEEERQKSEHLYRAIGESIDYGIWVCDPDGRNTYASKSFLDLVGVTQEQCSNFGWGDVLHPDDAERTIAAWKECVRTGGMWNIVHRFKGVDGQWHPILARGVPVRNEQGEVICWAGINLDISLLKKARKSLK